MADGCIVVVCWLLGKRVIKKAKVMHEYKALNPDELSLEVGQVVEILKQVCSAYMYCIFWAVVS